MHSAAVLHRSNKKYRKNPTFSIVSTWHLGNQTKQKAGSISIELGRREPNLKTPPKLGKTYPHICFFVGQIWANF
jgi:hypothetical protein